ncbi:MAG: MFS transporter, partial [Bacteroidetes bacterium]|nr:MFS transporter [Bacteroidota bacterium]
GAVILLVFNLLIVLKPELLFDINQRTLDYLKLHENIEPAEAHKLVLGQCKGEASRIAFVTVGVWWFLFSLIPFYYLPSNVKTGNSISLTKGYKELMKVFDAIKQSGLIKRYLSAFFFFSMGVQTVMYVAATFADKELKMPTEKLIPTILLIQLIAIAGAYLFSYVSKRIGNINAMLILTAIWTFICIGAYFIYSVTAFYILAALVGSVMGGIQSLSRSTYAKMIPQNSGDNASYFSFYEFSEKVAIAIGTFFFGFIEHITRLYNNEISMRNSVLSLVVFFIIGFILLYRIRHVKIEDEGV